VRVDRRLHNRALADLDVRVIRLKKREQPFQGTIQDVSDAGLCLILPCELRRDEMVKLQAADSTLFGYVIYSKWKRNAFRTGIEVERVLLGETDLAALFGTVLQETIPSVSVSR
jgi:hypothetical protein